jgi:hypothetical protein
LVTSVASASAWKGHDTLCKFNCDLSNVERVETSSSFSKGRGEVMSSIIIVFIFTACLVVGALRILLMGVL